MKGSIAPNGMVCLGPDALKGADFQALEFEGKFHKELRYRIERERNG